MIFPLQHSKPSKNLYLLLSFNVGKSNSTIETLVSDFNLRLHIAPDVTRIVCK